MIEKGINKFDYRDSIVVFLDILGFSDKIKKIHSSNGKKALFNTLSYMNAWGTTEGTNFFLEEDSFCSENYNQENLQKGNINIIKRKFKISYFSDSLVLSLEYGNNNLFKRFSMVAKSLAYLIIRLASAGFFIRGGVTIGKMFHEKNIFFGPALLTAYELESTIAIYPRVILSNGLITELNKTKRRIPCVSTAEDGLKHIDWIEFMKNNKKYFEENQVEIIKDYIKKNINQNNENLKIKAKYEWLMKQL